MTTTVKVEHVSGNKAVRVNVVHPATSTIEDFTILNKEESAEFLLYDGQNIAVEEVGEFLP